MSKCRFPEKSYWLSKESAEHTAIRCEMSAYRCFDHWHIGHKRGSSRAKRRRPIVERSISIYKTSDLVLGPRL